MIQSGSLSNDCWESDPTGSWTGNESSVLRWKWTNRRSCHADYARFKQYAVAHFKWWTGCCFLSIASGEMTSEELLQWLLTHLEQARWHSFQRYPELLLPQAWSRRNLLSSILRSFEVIPYWLKPDHCFWSRTYIRLCLPMFHRKPRDCIVI